MSEMARSPYVLFSVTLLLGSGMYFLSLFVR